MESFLTISNISRYRLNPYENSVVNGLSTNKNVGENAPLSSLSAKTIKIYQIFRDDITLYYTNILFVDA
jgi:hypothetical protein